MWNVFVMRSVCFLLFERIFIFVFMIVVFLFEMKIMNFFIDFLWFWSIIEFMYIGVI